MTLPKKWNESLGFPQIAGALEGVALAIPTTLGCVLLVYVHIGESHLGSGIVAAMLGLVLIHLMTLSSSRPMFFSTRLFEATTLAAMLEQLPVQLRLWGLSDTPEVRMAVLCLISFSAGLVLLVLYLVRADKLTRYIPAPVFSGFSNSIAVLLLVSQTQTLYQLAGRGQPLWLLLVVALVAGAVMFMLRVRMSRWPASAVGLAAGALVAQALASLGYPDIGGSAGAMAPTLPLFLADFHSLIDPSARVPAMLGQVFLNGLILGVMAFINTMVAMEAVTRLDDKEASGLSFRVMLPLGVALAGAMGSPVATASQQSTLGALRSAPVSHAMVLWAALLLAAFFAVGAVAWVPVAAICGVMLADAWFFVDKPSARHLWRWLGRERLSTNVKEDLGVVVAVTLTALIYNMVAAVLAGMLLGLLLFAARNARKPVRHIWTGNQMRSNCARARADLLLLDKAAQKIKVFELEGDMFFASATSLEQTVLAALAQARVAVIDWSRARHVDSSVALGMARLHKRAAASRVPLLHAGLPDSGMLGSTLAGHIPPDYVYPDLDHALEAAENHLLESERAAAAALHGEAPLDEIAIGLLKGLAKEEQAQVQARLRLTRHAKGEVVFSAGDPSNELVLVHAGSASVVVSTPTGQTMRLATVLAGNTLGEIGFLDGAPRSATVVAHEDLVLARLARSDFDELSVSHPQIVRRMISNIAVEMATRLRSTNALIAARNRSN